MHSKIHTPQTVTDLVDAEKAANFARASAKIPNDIATIANTLDLGSEYFWSPERLVPFEHWVGHIPFVFWLIKAVRPGRFVELGTHRGNSYFAMCQAVERLHLDAVGTAVDTWEGDVHMKREEGLFEEVKAYHDPRYSSFSTLHRATFDDARSYFSNGTVDLLHIDGTHTYEAVRHDFELWLPTLSERGVVLFHDISVRRDNFGVWRLWEELSEQYPAFAFAHSYGLGVLAVGKDQPPSFRALLDIARVPSEAALVRKLFAVRGDAIVDRLLRSQISEAASETSAALHSLREESARSAEAGAQDVAASSERAIAAEQSNSALRQRLAESESDRASLHQRLAESDSDSFSLRQRLAESELDSSGLRQRLAESESDCTSLRQRLAELESDGANLCQRLAESESDSAGLRRRLAELESGVAVQLKASAQAIDDALRQLAQADEANRQATSSLNAITTSTTWRATAPVRAVLSGHPSLARFGRRSLKVVWWTLTFQLAARLRARRNAVAALQSASPHVDRKSKNR